MVNAQVAVKINKTLKSGVALLDSAKTGAKYALAAAYFEEIALAQPNEWLPQYYTAYSLLLSTINTKAENERKDA